MAAVAKPEQEHHEERAGPPCYDAGKSLGFKREAVVGTNSREPVLHAQPSVLIP